MDDPMLLHLVDVAGISVKVSGDRAYKHLTHVNLALAIAKMALHEIAASSWEDRQFLREIATKAIDDMKGKM